MAKYKVGDHLIHIGPAFLYIVIKEVHQDHYKYIFLAPYPLHEAGVADAKHIDANYALDPVWVDQEIERLLLQPDAIETLARNITSRFPARKKSVDS